MNQDSAELQQALDSLGSLPTLPGVVRLLTSMVDDDKTSAADLGAVISRDQVLSAKLLRLVNSPIYGFPGRISSVKQALVLLGFNVVKGLVLGTAVFDQLAANLRGLWNHSLGAAIISRRIAKARGMPDAEEVMVAGLLHDLGKVVLSHVAPEAAEAAATTARLKRIHIAEAERKVIGLDHCEIAARVVKQWHLPQRLGDVLVHHHAPMHAEHNQTAAAIVHVADILARGMGYGDGGDPVMPPLDHAAYQMLGLSFEQIDQILFEAEREYSSGAAMFVPEG